MHEVLVGGIMDLEEAIRFVAGRMARRAEEMQDYPTVRLLEAIMSELGCKSYEELIRRLLDNPKEIYGYALSRVKEELTNSFLGMLFFDVFSRFGVGDLAPAYIEALREGDRENLRKIFLKVAEAVKRRRR
ncbi:MAG: hypothetical protein KIH01_03040, partial [Candidatus Freyarchaeota archaeon]|nr:hypothetical protein [Candidatus Jordarchaeia archaeon]